MSRDNNELRTLFRKPTHTDRSLDESSYNPTSHKATTVKTLTRRMQLVYDTPGSRLRDKTEHLNLFFTRTTTRLTLLHETFTDLLKLTQLTVTQYLLLQWFSIPYIEVTSGPSHGSYSPTTSLYPTKPTTAFQHLLTNVKGRDEPSNRQGAVYKTKCSDCQAFSATVVRLAETRLNSSLTEHKQTTQMVMPTIILLCIINWQTTTLSGTLLCA